MEMFIIYSSLSLVRLIHFKLPHAARHNYCNLLGSFWSFISLGCEPGAALPELPGSCRSSIPFPEGTTPAQASGHTNSFWFFQQRGIMEWFGISEPIPCAGTPSPSSLGHFQGFGSHSCSGQGQNSCPISQGGMAPPQPFLRLPREKKSSSSALCQRLHLVSLGKPHIFVKSCGCHYSI